MAGGKLTPRQKMINMMYLVLTALLALNVSREVMDAFYDVMKNQQTIISTVDKQNAAVYAAFDRAAADNPTKAGPWRDKAREVEALSNDVFKYIEDIKKELVEITGGEDPENPGKPKAMDNKEKVANYLILQGKGKELKAKLDVFRNELKVFAEGNTQLQEGFAEIFNTSDVKNKDGVVEPWEKNRFEHYPLIAVLTFLTNMQADIKNSEASTIDYLKTRIDADDFKINKLEAVAKVKSNFVLIGDEYQAEIFLAAMDDTQQPEIIIGGSQIPVESGKGIYTVKATSAGEKKWSGVIRVKKGTEIEEIPVSGEYNVSPPTVVISPSKLNVLYRNVDNPLDIGVPGVDPSRIRVSGPGITKNGEGWSADVTKLQGKETTITVQVVDENGKVTQNQSKAFRIKGLPLAEGSILKRSTGTLSAGVLSNAKIEAGYPDFPYDLSLDVTGFEVRVDGYPPQKVNGNTFDATTKSRIASLKPGQSITVRNIVAKTTRGDRITNIAPISIDVN